jgi:hypothetical protein
MTFCDACKTEHSMKVLKLQVEHNMTIRELLLDAKFFTSVQWMGDYLGVSFVTIYHWIEKYYGMTYQEFKRKYICKCDRCYLLDISISPYSRNDYILNKIRSRRGCACFDSRYPNFIMTKMPLHQVLALFKSEPGIKVIKEGVYAIAPRPVYFNRDVNPVSIRESSIIREEESVEELEEENVILNLGRYDIFEVLSVSEG